MENVSEEAVSRHRHELDDYTERYIKGTEYEGVD
jgi:hypothetical protein